MFEFFEDVIFFSQNSLIMFHFKYGKYNFKSQKCEKMLTGEYLFLFMQLISGPSLPILEKNI